MEEKRWSHILLLQEIRVKNAIRQLVKIFTDCLSNITNLLLLQHVHYAI